MNTNRSPAILIQLIEEKRIAMIAVGIEKGLNSEETIKLSKELDLLLNEYDKQFAISKS
ncbi:MULTISPECIES: aspartyl-phosphate phosphatase Spo0E family protein [Bacillus]|uniref:aspartyl-phosphate phosphatase Spo0E family protein n=1 Tax=Bacillus TaxID=1386 RepID=UPI0002F361A5|nr:aspartyl-phosphate phosphatase Spo0E family protein [Bacillus smithii]AKP46650.1 hypothetical protein BSM4216_1369 [Bacillus smithii]MED0660936.1 aspartyl-phosphate phosphatase Spo0E family protein [Bacillus smithii]MED1419604.1 aspartyl-phosphate phosphatase Spo0E family protein [Bacillus smithii]MED1455970.1 aspartyl-phosphate phosphatase Spo0E family protein [Bacillus smithii]MED1489389.1 aspartyl-phosphate phosphatase Spo0E family protein [Bacillus smithii]